MPENKITKNQISDFIFNQEEEGKLVLLFSDTQQMRQTNAQIDAMIRNSPEFVVEKTNKFKSQRNMIRYKNKIVYFGLTNHEKYLLESYPQEIVKNYAEDEARN